MAGAGLERLAEGKPYYDLAIGKEYACGGLKLRVEKGRIRLLPGNNWNRSEEEITLVMGAGSGRKRFSIAGGSRQVAFLDDYAVAFWRIEQSGEQGPIARVKIDKLELGKETEITARVPYNFGGLEITFYGGITCQLMHGGDALQAYVKLKKGKSEALREIWIEGTKNARTCFEGYAVTFITGFWDYLKLKAEKTREPSEKASAGEEEQVRSFIKAIERERARGKKDWGGEEQEIGLRYEQDLQVGLAYRIGALKARVKEAFIEITPSSAKVPGNRVENAILELEKGRLKRQCWLSRFKGFDECASELFEGHTVSFMSMNDRSIFLRFDKFKPGDSLSLVPGAVYKIGDFEVKIAELSEEEAWGAKRQVALVDLAGSGRWQFYLAGLPGSDPDEKLLSRAFFDGCSIDFYGGGRSGLLFSIKEFKPGDEILLFKGIEARLGGLALKVKGIARPGYSLNPQTGLNEWDWKVKIEAKTGKGKKAFTLARETPAEFKGFKLALAGCTDERALVKVSKARARR